MTCSPAVSARHESSRRRARWLHWRAVVVQLLRSYFYGLQCLLRFACPQFGERGLAVLQDTSIDPAWSLDIANTIGFNTDGHDWTRIIATPTRQTNRSTANRRLASCAILLLIGPLAFASLKPLGCDARGHLDEMDFGYATTIDDVFDAPVKQDDWTDRRASRRGGRSCAWARGRKTRRGRDGPKFSRASRPRSSSAPRPRSSPERPPSSRGAGTARHEGCGRPCAVLGAAPTPAPTPAPVAEDPAGERR